MHSAAPPAPFDRSGGRLRLEQVELVDVVDGLDGRAARVVSRAAVLAAAGREPRTIAIGRLEPPELVGALAARGHHVAVSTPHELELATGCGCPRERIVADGCLADDGYVKDLVLAGVGAVRADDAWEEENVRRIAAALGREVPLGRPVPPPLPAGAFARCGGVVAVVLREPPRLVLDVGPVPGAPAPPNAAAGTGGRPAVWPLDARAGAGSTGGEATVQGVAADVPRPVTVHGEVRRGDAVLVPDPGVLDVRPLDPAIPPPLTVLVHGTLWRALDPRPPPAHRS